MFARYIALMKNINDREVLEGAIKNVNHCSLRLIIYTNRRHNLIDGL